MTIEQYDEFAAIVKEMLQVCDGILEENYLGKTVAEQDRLHRRFHELDDRIEELSETLGQRRKSVYRRIQKAYDYLGDRGHCPLGLLK